VVYLVHGYISKGQYSWINGPAGCFPATTNSWVKDGKVKEMIVVMPNSVNKLLGSWYANSVGERYSFFSEAGLCWLSDLAIVLVNPF
jgi:hypothetical protein